MQSNLINLTTVATLGLAIIGAAGSGTVASAQAAEHFPDIRLRYADLALDTRAGRRAFARRVETTAQDHCTRYGALIVPAARRGQPRFCFDGVRAEIVQALSPSLRAAYDDGRRQMAQESARWPSTQP